MLEFFVPGIPRPSGSKKGFPVRRRDGTLGVAITDTSGAPGRDWRASVQLFALRAMEGRTLYSRDVPLIVTVEFRLPRPKAHFTKHPPASSKPKLKGPPAYAHCQKPDRGKLLRAVEDALTGIVWTDDSQVVGGDASKRWCAFGEPPGALITIAVRGPSDS